MEWILVENIFSKRIWTRIVKWMMVYYYSEWMLQTWIYGSVVFEIPTIHRFYFVFFFATLCSSHIWCQQCVPLIIVIIILHPTLNKRVDVIIAGIAFNIERGLYKIGRWETNKKATDQLAYENTFEFWKPTPSDEFARRFQYQCILP